VHVISANLAAILKTPEDIASQPIAE